jgi:hypothetical protein
VSSLSPRVGLVVMSDSDFVDPNVVAKDSVKLDAMTSLTQCTSTTRPATPFDGQWIYETDMQNVRRWSQADGKWYLKGGSGVASATGLVQQFSDATAHTLVGVAGGTNIQTISLHDYNLMLQKGHTYKIIEHGWFSLTGTYQQVSGNFIHPEFFTTYNIGSNPGTSDANSLHYFHEPYQKNVNPNKRPYYKTFNLTVPGSVGIGQTSNVFLRSLMRQDVSFMLSTQNLGRPASASFPARAYVYDLGILGAN